LKTYGTEKLGAMIERTCALAGYLEARILAEPRLELLAPVQLNIVCFRYRAAEAYSNTLNGEIVSDIQESGISAPSTTMLDGRLAIRAAIVNHRTDIGDIDALVAAVLEFGARRASGSRDAGAERSASRAS
jgi:aromatic-L-amino-acid decarboxylase